MKQHYKTLQVSQRATPEVIKEQYRKLAREHHPDKFHEHDEKLAAEVRFVEITEAYNVLKRTFVSSEKSVYTDPNQPPTPVLSQTLLDFGTISSGTRKTITFIVQNDGGPVESVRFDYDKARGWLKVKESVVEHGEDGKFPLEVEVTVDTEKMGQWSIRQEKIDVWLDDQMARVTLIAEVKKQPKILTFLPRFSPQFTALVLFLVALVAGIFSLAQTHDGPLIFASGSLGTTERAIVESSEGEYTITGKNRVIPDTGLNLPPAGRPLLFSTGTKQSMLYVMHDKQGKPSGLDLEGHSPIWSPIGQQIAFLRNTESGTQLFIADISTTTAQTTNSSAQSILTADNPEQLTDNQQAKTDISWSPDGQHIAFRERFSSDDGSSFEVLKAIDLQTRTPRLLSIPAQGNVSHFVWAHDSQALFATFSGESSNESSEKVYIVNMENGFAEPFVQFESRDAAWSPDGTRVAIASDQGLFLLDKGKKNVKRLSTFSNWKPLWSPRGSTVAFLGVADGDSVKALPTVVDAADRADADLWLLDISTDQLIRLTTTGAIDFAWGETDDLLVYTATSEDSSDSALYMWSLELGKQAEMLAEVSDPQMAWASQ